LADTDSVDSLLISMLLACNHALTGSSATVLSQRRVPAIPRRSGTLVARSGSTDQGKTRPPSEVPAAKEHGSKKVQEESKVSGSEKEKKGEERHPGNVQCHPHEQPCCVVFGSVTFHLSLS
jgi:hypothetical protein